MCREKQILYRIICGTVELGGQNVVGKIDRVMDNTVHLRNATKRIAVLHFQTVFVAFYMKLID